MNWNFLLLFLLLYLASCKYNTTTDTESLFNIIDNDAELTMISSDTYNFGNIIQGQILDIQYEFQNTGSGDLVITNVDASCGCTIPFWPKQNIPSGQKSFIQVKFDSHNRLGPQTKKIKVLSNGTPNIKILTFIGNILIDK